MPDSDAKQDRLDRLCTALATDERRAVLAYFPSSDDDDVSFDDLVEWMVARDTLPHDRETVALTLHHKTLPKSADSGLVDYDDRSQGIRYRGDPLVERVVSRIARIEVDT